MIALLFLISVIIFIAYNASIVSIYGVPNSLSASFYNLREHNVGFLFTIFCWTSALPLLIYWIEYSPNDWNFLPFISCAGLMFVGTAPAFKDVELERKVHSISAIVCAVGAYVWSILFGSVFLSVNFILLSGILYFLIKNNKIYWLELMAFINIYLQLLITSLW